jgi:hypothetical protein
MVQNGPAVPLRRYDSASGGLLAKPGSPAEGEDVPGEAKGRKVTRAHPEENGSARMGCQGVSGPLGGQAQPRCALWAHWGRRGTGK